MNWHTRYAQQANWTRELQSYIFEKIGFQQARRVLEAGCGTGAVLSELSEGPQLYGLDLNRDSLVECGVHAPQAKHVQGDVLTLPFIDRTFDITYCHFLLLWVMNPLQALQEMKRVTRQGGYVIAFAEPDYLQRVDRPEGLVPLGKWQTEALRRQGADPGVGARLAEFFHEAGIRIVETGTIQSNDTEPSLEEWKLEWDVIESDLQSWVPTDEMDRMKNLDWQARSQGTRVLYVPTYFAWGQV
jgi:ubiquinone/menaquinone biosynthesis C-methylase UbiE